MGKLILILGLLSCSFSFAKVSTHFYNQFQLIKNHKGEQIIIDREIRDNISVDRYIHYLGSLLDPSNKKVRINSFQCTGKFYEKPYRPGLVFDLQQEIIKALKVHKLINNKLVKKILIKLEKRVHKYIDRPNYPVIANLDNKFFFTNQKILKEIKDGVLDKLVSHLDPTTIFKFIRYFIKEYESLIDQKRHHSQMTLLYYLTNYPPETLGLTEEQVKKALSSIYEYRIKIGISSIKKAKKLRKDWLNYGEKQLAKEVNTSKQRFQKISKKLTEAHEISRGFYNIVYKDQDLLINSWTDRKPKDRTPALVYDRGCPLYIKTKRLKYQSAQMAVSLTPLSLPTKIFLQILGLKKKITFRHQTYSETLLRAHLKIIGEYRLEQIIKDQSLNPIL